MRAVVPEIATEAPNPLVTDAFGSASVGVVGQPV
jgi:hypothetical protein